MVRGGPGILPDGLLVSLRWVVRDGPGGLRDGSLMCHFGGSFGLRRAQRLVRQLACVSLRQMVRGGPGILPDGLLVLLWHVVRGGSGILPDGSSCRFGGWFEVGLVASLTARLCVASADRSD